MEATLLPTKPVERVIGVELTLFADGTYGASICAEGDDLGYGVGNSDDYAGTVDSIADLLKTSYAPINGAGATPA